MDATIIPLHQMYLSLLAAIFAADKCATVQQDFPDMADPSGRLYAVRDGTTVPEIIVEYSFARDSVEFKCLRRNAAELMTRRVSYAEGLDGFGEELQKFVQAGRLAHGTSAKSKR